MNFSPRDGEQENRELLQNDLPVSACSIEKLTVTNADNIEVPFMMTVKQYFFASPRNARDVAALGRDITCPELNYRVDCPRTRWKRDYSITVTSGGVIR